MQGPPNAVSTAQRSRRSQTFAVWVRSWGGIECGIAGAELQGLPIPGERAARNSRGSRSDKVPQTCQYSERFARKRAGRHCSTPVRHFRNPNRAADAKTLAGEEFAHRSRLFRDEVVIRRLPHTNEATTWSPITIEQLDDSAPRWMDDTLTRGAGETRRWLAPQRSRPAVLTARATGESR